MKGFQKFTRAGSTQNQKKYCPASKNISVHSSGLLAYWLPFPTCSNSLGRSWSITCWSSWQIPTILLCQKALFMFQSLSFATFSVLSFFNIQCTTLISTVFKCKIVQILWFSTKFLSCLQHRENTWKPVQSWTTSTWTQCPFTILSWWVPFCSVLLLWFWLQLFSWSSKLDGLESPLQFFLRQECTSNKKSWK